jgi:beta-lactamase regulating signal transducer with metallopeptidase domain
MQSHLLNYLFANEVIQAMFRTLMHSLWQGILLASIAGLILIYTKNAGAVLRYKIHSCIMLAINFKSFGTLSYELYSVAYSSAAASQPIVIATNNNITAQQPQSNLIEKIITIFKSGERFIVLGWLIIITLKSINLLTGLRSVHRLKRTQISSAGDYWNDQLKTLAVKAGVTRPVILLKSAIAEIPMVLGHLKPVILFPASALTTLAAEEIEAILLHELAHIRRKDYIVNILQSIAEILFFFNPAVLWISSLIKEERENCCDDIAVREVKNKKQFIHALISFQEHNLSSKYAASFSGERNYLLNRIKRIITNNNKTLSNMEKIFLAAGIIITCFIAVAFTQHKQFSFKNIVAPNVKEIAFAANRKDTVPETVNDDESKYTMNTSMDGKQYKIVEVNGKVTELYIDNVRIPDDKISDYSAVINKLQEKLKADKQEQKEAMKEQQQALDAQAEAMKAKALALNDMMQQKEKINEEVLKEKSLIMKEQAEKLAEVMKEKDVMIKDQAEKQAKLMQEQAEKLAEVMKEKDVIIKDQADKQAKLMQEKAEKLAEVMNEKNVLIKEQVEKETKMIKDKTEKQIQIELKKQIEELKEQNEQLKEQLKQKADSIYKSNPAAPAGA